MLLKYSIVTYDMKQYLIVSYYTISYLENIRIELMKRYYIILYKRILKIDIINNDVHNI